MIILGQVLIMISLVYKTLEDIITSDYTIMKNLLTIGTILFACIAASAQTKVATFKAYERQTYTVYAYNSNARLITLVEGYTSFNHSTYLVLQNEQVLDRFVSELISVKNKFSEWSQVAKKNKVSRYYKDIPTNFPTVYVTDRYTDDSSNFHEISFPVKAEFNVNDEGRPWLLLSCRADWRAYNNHIYTTEWELEIKSTSQLEGLIDALDKNKIKAKAASKRDDLFK